jgi:hypothetical protein
MIKRSMGILLLSLLLLACAAPVGSAAWCKQMKAKPKADWSLNQATDFAKHCLL